METTLAVKLVLAMEFLSPAERITSLPQFPGWEETASERSARYASIADDIESVCMSESVLPAFVGKRAREKTAFLVLSTAFMESGFAPDVDKGPCFRRGKMSSRCDGGQSACMLQIMVGDGETREGYTKEELFADRKKCIEAGVGKMRTSLKHCVPLVGHSGGLAMFASGSCRGGIKESKARMDLFDRTYDRFFMNPKKDDRISFRHEP